MTRNTDSPDTDADAEPETYSQFTVVEHTGLDGDDETRRDLHMGAIEEPGTKTRLPTPTNDLDSVTEIEYEPVAVLDLPDDEMTQTEFVSWWNDHYDADDRPEAIERAVELADRVEGDDDA